MDSKQIEHSIESSVAFKSLLVTRGTICASSGTTATDESWVPLNISVSAIGFIFFLWAFSLA